MRQALLPCFLSILALGLASCTGFQVATFHPDGSPKMIAQVDAVLSEGENSAREIVTPSGIRFTSVQQRYDGTRVAGGALDAWTMSSLAKLAQPQAIKATKDPNIIPKDPNTLPKDPNSLPFDPNLIRE